jgi:hypothetical protein
MLWYWQGRRQRSRLVISLTIKVDSKHFIKVDGTLHKMTQSWVIISSKHIFAHRELLCSKSPASLQTLPYSLGRLMFGGRLISL